LPHKVCSTCSGARMSSKGKFKCAPAYCLQCHDRLEDSVNTECEPPPPTIALYTSEIVPIRIIVLVMAVFVVLDLRHSLPPMLGCLVWRLRRDLCARLSPVAAAIKGSFSSERTHKGMPPVFLQIVEAQIAASQNELEASKIYKQHQEEYEVIKSSLMQLPPRSQTEKEIEKVLAETEELKKESMQLDRDIAVCTSLSHRRVVPTRTWTLVP
jgi:hypothetical protein